MNNKERIRQLKKRLKISNLDAVGSLEDANGTFNPTMTEHDIKIRQQRSKETLLRFVKDSLGNEKDLVTLVDKIIAEGGEALRALSNDDTTYLNENIHKLDRLELILQTDGSRPSFLIKNGTIDYASSPVTDWGDMLINRVSDLEYAIDAVGRINCFGAAIGTGFLIAPNIIVTNLHVLEAIGNMKNSIWEINDSAHIDFGHEFRGITTKNRARLKRVVFTGSNPIKSTLNHNNLDLAVIEIENIANGPKPLSLDLSDNWPADELVIFTIGYPTTYQGYSYNLLDLLFQSQFGFKRLSPGRIQTENITGMPSWTLSHDATTLGGNSGSPILVIRNEKVSAGLHYGGTRSPLSNWGHILGHTLSTTYKGKTLKEILSTVGVQFYQ